MFWFNGFFCDIRSEENLTAVAFHGTADCGLLTVVISRPKPKDRRCFRWRGFCLSSVGEPDDQRDFTLTVACIFAVHDFDVHDVWRVAQTPASHFCVKHSVKHLGSKRPFSGNFRSCRGVVDLPVLSKESCGNLATGWYTKEKGSLFRLPPRAENETRTRDPNLGKVVLYQLSYFRKTFFLPLLLRFCVPFGWCKSTIKILFCKFFRKKIYWTLPFVAHPPILLDKVMRL